MVPYKRPAADKSGVPVYQPNAATTYQQLMQLQQPFVPVSCEYSVSPAPPTSSTASPTVPEAAASAQTASVAALSAANYMQQTQPPPSQTQQTAQLVAVKETEQQQVAMSSAVTSTSMVTNSLPAQQQPLTVFHDPAAIAKEVAQQNYAKAVKLAAMTATSMAQLNPLNYTGVALNKQALSMPQPALRYPSGALPFSFGAHLGGLAATNPYSAAIAQQNFLNMTRGPAATLSLNPYSFMRPVTTPAYGGVVTTAASPLFNGGLLATAQYPTAAVAPSATTVAPASAVQNNNNNNNVVVQPYKKLKTS